MSSSWSIFYGTIVNPAKTKDTLDIISDGFIITHGSKIIAMGRMKDFDRMKSAQPELTNPTEVHLTSTQLLLPGLIDTHIHAPQYPNIGLGYDAPLMGWLSKYTYKLESKYSDLEFSKRVYDAVVKKTLSFGTTTACYFASMYTDSSLVLADAAIAGGQRAFVGKVNMTRLAPANYIETPEASIKQTEAFVGEVLAKGSDLVQPIVTPRFALSVEMELMRKLAELARRHDLNIQTHISENADEVKMVADMFNGAGYADVYNQAELLTCKTVLAHGVFLTEAEMVLLAAKGVSISHCPSSNTRLRSGLCNVRLLQKHGVNIGLGTDVAGGSAASIIDAMRCAVDTSTHLTHLTNGFKAITAYEAFYMATIGGAKALAIDDKVGSLEVGKEFDALIVDLNVEHSSADLIGDYDTFELFQKFVFSGDDRNVRHVYVAGKRVI